MRGHYIVFVVECRHELGGHTATVWGEGQSVSLIPLSPTRLGAMIYLDDRNPIPPSTTAPLDWRSYFSTLFQAYPAWVRGCMQALQPGDEVFADQILMVPARRLARGGVALVGDAGYCPTFFSGMGAAAALLGAYALSRQLDKHTDVRTALKAYEAAILPVVRGYQRSAVESRRRTLARGVMARLRNFAAAHIPEKLGEIASRRNYHSRVTMQSLGG
jgi:2-polyprenyl-6-methoxyphenol hydroxylase-like FAD-dependent oxidoreductase